MPRPPHKTQKGYFDRRKDARLSGGCFIIDAVQPPRREGARPQRLRYTRLKVRML